MKSLKSTLAVAGLALALLLTVSGCTKSDETTVADNPALAAPIPAGMVRGAVLETMNSGGYTYVLIGTEQIHRWLAARETTVQVGDVVQAFEGMPMEQFESKTLNRTFDVIYFVDALHNLSAPAANSVNSMPADLPATDRPAEEPAADVQVAEL